MRQALILLLATLLAGQAAAEGNSSIYKWTDEDGNVHYGDRPPRDGAAEEVRLRGSRPEPVEVLPSELNGTWFGRQDDGGEVRMRLQDSGAIRYTQTFPDQTIYNYQGVWRLEDRSLSVITEFIEEGGGGNLNRTVEPVQITYNFLEFSPDELTMINNGQRYTLSKVQ